MTIKEICDHASRKITIEILSLYGVIVPAPRIAHNTFGSVIQGNGREFMLTEGEE